MSAPTSPTSELLPTLTPDLHQSVFARLLRDKAVGKPFPRSHRSFIHDADPYSAPPADLVRGRDHAPGTDRGDGRGGHWYFCFPAKYQETTAGQPDATRSRTVVAGGGGRGCWNSERTVSILGPDGKSVGAYAHRLSYVLKTKNPAGAVSPYAKESLGWCMVEIGIEEKQEQEQKKTKRKKKTKKQEQELVICKIYRSPRSDPETSHAGSGVPPLCDIRVSAGMSEAGGGERGRADATSELGKGWVIQCKSGAAAAAAADTVMKFGGSSISSAEQMMQAAIIVLTFPEERPPPVVVLSAMEKTTTNLHLAAVKALRWRTQSTWEIHELDAIQELHLSTIDALGLDRSIISGSLDELKQLLKHVALDHKLTPKTRDLIVSHGELMSTTIFSAYLNKLGKGTQQEWASSAISIVGSGGSDWTAITIARELRPREIVVWKDVNGLFTCDPNVFESALPLPYLTFEEAAALGFFAAQSMELAMESDIPVIVKSLYNPQAPGTMLTKTREMNESELTRIMLTSNLTMLDIKSTGIVDRSGFVTEAFSIFTKFGISVDHAAISQGEILIILVPSKLLSHELIQMKLDVVIEELQRIAHVHPLSHRSFISLIQTAEMSTTILEKAFGALTRIDVKTQMSSHGSTSKAMKIFLVVNDNEAKDCVEALRSEFVDKDFVSEVHEADSEHNGSLVPVSSSAAASSGDKRKPDDEHGTQRMMNTYADNDHMDMGNPFGNFDNTLTAEGDIFLNAEEHLSLFADEEEDVYVAPKIYEFPERGRTSSSLPSSPLQATGRRRVRRRKAPAPAPAKYLSLSLINTRSRPPAA